jgi:ribosomal protein L16/L10AE
MGDVSGFGQGKYAWQVSLISNEAIQIRDNAIESARQWAHRALEEKFKGNFYFL